MNGCVCVLQIFSCREHLVWNIAPMPMPDKFLSMVGRVFNELMELKFVRLSYLDAVCYDFSGQLALDPLFYFLEGGSL